MHRKKSWAQRALRAGQAWKRCHMRICNEPARAFKAFVQTFSKSTHSQPFFLSHLQPIHPSRLKSKFGGLRPLGEKERPSRLLGSRCGWPAAWPLSRACQGAPVSPFGGARVWSVWSVWSQDPTPPRPLASPRARIRPCWRGRLESYEGGDVDHGFYMELRFLESNLRTIGARIMQINTEPERHPFREDPIFGVSILWGSRSTSSNGNSPVLSSDWSKQAI